MLANQLRARREHRNAHGKYQVAQYDFIRRTKECLLRAVYSLNNEYFYQLSKQRRLYDESNTLRNHSTMPWV